MFSLSALGKSIGGRRAERELRGQSARADPVRPIPVGATSDMQAYSMAKHSLLSAADVECSSLPSPGC
jgi:hypothetical protein